MSHYNVLGIGIAFTDLIALAPREILSRYGVPYGGGIELSLLQMTQLKKELKEIQFLPGGSVANSLAGIAALGGKTGFFGKIAQDESGLFFKKDLALRGIDFLGKPELRAAPMSATCIVLVLPDGERSCPFNVGCGEKFSVSEFSEFDFGQSKILLIQGQLLLSEDARPALIKALELANKHGCKVAVTLSEITSWHAYPDIAQNLIATKADLIVGNEGEMASLRKAAFFPCSSEQIIITTKGQAGAEAQVGSDIIQALPQKPTSFVNTLGAGDQFLAGLLWGLSRDFDLKESMDLAIQNATQILGEVGARPPLPRKA